MSAEGRLDARVLQQRRPMDRSADGFTLVEMIVVLGIFAVVASVVTVVIAHATSVTAAMSQRADTSVGVRAAADHMQQVISQGAIVAAGSSVLVVDVDEPGRCVRWSFSVTRDDAGNPQSVREEVEAIAVGVQGRCADVATSAWSSADRTRTLVQGLTANPQGAPVWQVYSRGNAPLDVTATSGPSIADPCQIARVDITFSTASGTGGDALVTARSSASVLPVVWGMTC